MKDELAVAIIQTDLYWEDVTANLSSIEEKIAQLEKPADIIVLPEMFNSGFTMNTKLAEPVNFTTTRWMKQLAKQTNALLIGSFAVKDAGKFYNRLFAVFPDGSFVNYDKRHLFRMGMEHEVYSSGTSHSMIRWRGWNILGLVCYDLRFPVWSRNTATDPYDLLIYVANWPARRASAWSTLLKARAIENQCYVVGVNRVGVDGNGLVYQGDSIVHDFLGESVCMLHSAEQCETAHLSKESLESYRNEFPAHLDSDVFHITIQSP
jgi:omega-amidase